MSTDAAPTPQPPTPPISTHTTTHRSASEEGDMLSALERAARYMVKNAARGSGHAAITKELGVVKGELEISNAQLAAVKADLCLAQERERSLQQSRGRALLQLDRMDMVLDLTRSHMNFLESEYKTARSELSAARIIVETTRAGKYELLRAKQKAEQRCRVQEDHTQTANETIKSLQGELAVEKARVVELETQYGV